MPTQNARFISATALSLFTSSCGLQTPTMQSPLRPSPTSEVVLNIIYHVQEELACAVYAIKQHDRGRLENNKIIKDVPWLLETGAKAGVAKVTLTLTVDDKTTIAPSLSDTALYPNKITSFTHGGNIVSPQSFSLGIGVSGSAEANRKISTDYTFSIRDDLLNFKNSNFDIVEDCDENTGALKLPTTGAMISGDLRIADSFLGLLGYYTAQTQNNGANQPLGKALPPDTLQTDITFTLNGSGSVSPFWKLVPISPGSSTLPLLAASRNSIDEVLVTLGPNTPATATAHNITKANSGGAAVGSGGT